MDNFRLIHLQTNEIYEFVGNITYKNDSEENKNLLEIKNVAEPVV